MTLTSTKFFISFLKHCILVQCICLMNISGYLGFAVVCLSYISSGSSPSSLLCMSMSSHILVMSSMYTTTTL